MFDGLGRATLFYKLALKAGSQQMRVRLEDTEKTTFKKKFGHFEIRFVPTYIPIGLPPSSR